jgi:hypothetical protein
MKMTSEPLVRAGVCAGCESDADELVPWASKRLCWDCVDKQIDLLARAVADLPVTVVAR